jgi:hypothetical protein
MTGVHQRFLGRSSHAISGTGTMNPSRQKARKKVMKNRSGKRDFAQGGKAVGAESSKPGKARVMG